MLNIDKKTEDSTMFIALEGQLDTDTAPSLESVLLGDLSDLETLEIDMAKLDYISSAGLRVLLRAKKIMGKRPFNVSNVTDPVMDVLEITGFTDILGIAREE